MFKQTSIAITLSAISLGGCRDKAAPEPVAEQPIEVGGSATPTVTNPAREAEKYFKARCAVCHGPGGTGDGPGAAAIDPKPRAFTDPAWQDETSDEQIMKISTEGGPAVGKSPGMPAHADLKAKPEVLKGIVELVRGFRKEG